jgi:hypothetical protein
VAVYPDPYHDAAFICICLICDNCPDKCKSALESDELAGQPAYPTKGWDEALGNEARRRGWKIEYSGDGFLILCPHCAKTAPPRNT